MSGDRRKVVVLGMPGPVLDRGEGARRWEMWRPTVALCQQEDLRIDRFEMWVDPRFGELADRVAADIGLVSPETEVVRSDLGFSDAWDFEEVFSKLHGWARGYRFDPDAEDYLVHITTGSHVQQICLFLLTESRHFPARLVQTAPPRRKDSGEPGRFVVIDLDLSRYDRIAGRFEREREEGASFLKSGIATRNAAFNRMIGEIERVAVRSAAPILLTGPTGAGKSHLARRIYELKKARHQVAGAFVEVNCATIRGDAAGSALFGHVRGAFTGAVASRRGHLMAADGGMLFLDEVGELGLDEQAMLLRAVEEKRFFPVGADREVASDFLLIAGTNRDLGRAVAEGRFREDLLARINLWTFRLPALRERPEDIEPNLDYELDEWRRRTGTQVTFNREARERFLEFAVSDAALWRGNFRDLNAAVARMATLAAGKRIGVTEVTEEIRRLRTMWEPGGVVVSGAAPGGRENASGDLEKLLGADGWAALDEFDRVQLEHVVAVCRECPSLAEAGRRLFAASRRRRGRLNDADRLRKYLLKFGLTRQALASLASD